MREARVLMSSVNCKLVFRKLSNTALYEANCCMFGRVPWMPRLLSTMKNDRSLLNCISCEEMVP